MSNIQLIRRMDITAPHKSFNVWVLWNEDSKNVEDIFVSGPHPVVLIATLVNDVQADLGDGIGDQTTVRQERTLDHYAIMEFSPSWFFLPSVNWGDGLGDCWVGASTCYYSSETAEASLETHKSRANQ